MTPLASVLLAYSSNFANEVQKTGFLGRMNTVQKWISVGVSVHPHGNKWNSHRELSLWKTYQIAPELIRKNDKFNVLLVKVLETTEERGGGNQAYGEYGKSLTLTMNLYILLYNFTVIARAYSPPSPLTNTHMHASICVLAATGATQRSSTAV